MKLGSLLSESFLYLLNWKSNRLTIETSEGKMLGTSWLIMPTRSLYKFGSILSLRSSLESRVVNNIKSITKLMNRIISEKRLWQNLIGLSLWEIVKISCKFPYSRYRSDSAREQGKLHCLSVQTVVLRPVIILVNRKSRC